MILVSIFRRVPRNAIPPSSHFLQASAFHCKRSAAIRSISRLITQVYTIVFCSIAWMRNPACEFGAGPKVNHRTYPLKMLARRRFLSKATQAARRRLYVLAMRLGEG